MVLSGTVQRASAYGAPGYGEHPDSDAQDDFYSLRLEAPICVRGDDDEIEPREADIRRLQIVFDRIPFEKLSAGAHVRVKGRLFHAVSGHHHTKVLISPETIEHP